MKRFINVMLFAVIAGVVLAACGAQPSPTPTLTAAGSAAPTTTGATAACSTENYAPPNEFRSDPSSKLTASTKPKLIEFFAFW